MALQDQVDVPVQLLAQVFGDPGGQLDEVVAVGQEALVLIEVQRPQAQAELVLAVPDVGAQADVHAQARRVDAEAAALGQLQPLADVFLDRHRDLEILREDHPQAVRVAGLRGEVAGVVVACGIRQRLAPRRLGMPRPESAARRADQ